MSEPMDIQEEDIGDFIKQNYTSPTQHIPFDCVRVILEYLYFNVHRYAFLLYKNEQQPPTAQKSRYKRPQKLPAATPSNDKQLHPAFIKVLYGYYEWDIQRKIFLLFPNLFINGTKSYDCNGQIIPNIFIDDEKTSLVRQMIPPHGLTSLWFDSFIITQAKALTNPRKTLSYLLTSGTNYKTLKCLSLPFQSQVNDECLQSVISKCSFLEYLDLSGTGTTLQGLRGCLSPEIDEGMMDIGINLPELRTLLVNNTVDCKRNDFKDPKLIVGLINRSWLERLELSGQNIDDSFVHDLLLSHPYLKKLCIRDCEKITTEAFRDIEKNRILSTLDIGLCKIGDEALLKLAKSPSLTELISIRNEVTGSLALDVIVRANKISKLTIHGDLVRNKSVEFSDEIMMDTASWLRHLDLSCNKAFSNPEKLKGLVNVNMGIYEQLFMLNLSRCGLVDECCRILFQERYWPLLDTLDLSMNDKLTNEAIKYICATDETQALSVPTSASLPQLRTLILRGNSKITDESATMLSQNPTITTLDVSGTHIGTKGAQLLIAGEPYCALRELSLERNSLDDAVFIDHPITNTNLTVLNLAQNNISDKGAKVLFDMKNDRNVLMSISLISNDLKDEAVRWLLRNTNLDCLKIQSNEVSDEMKSKLVTQCTDIQDLNI
jgi:hypothetical protein